VNVRPSLRVSRGFNSLVGSRKSIEVSVDHGYLWIGPKDGPCLVHISGKKTLHKIAAMLKRYAR
jgi:hypothetical protein